MAAAAEDRAFYDRQRKRLEEMREVLVEKVILETNEYNDLFKDLNAKDSAEVAREFEDQETVGILADIDRNRLQKIFWALYRLDHGTYIVCRQARQMGEPVQ